MNPTQKLTGRIEVYQQTEKPQTELAALQQPTKPSPAPSPAELKPRLLRLQIKPSKRIWAGKSQDAIAVLEQIFPTKGRFRGKAWSKKKNTLYGG